MKHLSSFQSYQEEIIVKQIIEYIDYSINESINIGDIWNKVCEKIKGLSEQSKRKIFKYALGTILAYATITNVYDFINNSNISNQDKKIATEIVEDLNEFKPGYEFKLSKSGWTHIKEEEHCELEAYKLGDGKITVGYGHAQPVKKSKIKVGERITQEQADKFLKEDLKEAADGVRRIFTEWEEKGNVVTITQSMFDALVSLAFNSGISNLRQSDVIKNLKKKDYKLAGDSIKEYKVRKKFPGLQARRQKESQMFLTKF
jgi:GH24 family phage-related lysozyme (muramidase)